MCIHWAEFAWHTRHAGPPAGGSLGLKRSVLGATGITADMIADTNSVCPWMNRMYGFGICKETRCTEYLNSNLKNCIAPGVLIL